MRSSRYIIIRKRREATEIVSRPMDVMKGLGLTLIALILTALTGAGLLYAFFTQSLPSLEQFESHYSRKPEPTRFYARDGETLLFTLAYEDFESQDLSICESDGEGCFPKTFLEASRITRRAAVEKGDMRPLREEMIREIYTQYISESRWPDLALKLLDFQIRKTYSDEQIEAWYYNNAWFGQMAFGLDAASRLYLDKTADTLNDAECVLMSAILNAPMLNPIDSKGALRDFYLSQLASLQHNGLFDGEEADALARSNFIIFEPPPYAGKAEPDIITRKALNTVINLYGREQVERGGLNIITAEDVPLQTYLNCISSAEVLAESSSCPLSSTYTDSEIQTASEALMNTPISIAVLDVKTGQILAELEAETDRERNRVYNSALQNYSVGTNMNFFAALTAFIGGSSPSTLLWDLENMYESSALVESNEEFRGPVQLRETLAQDLQRPLEAHLLRFGSGAVQRNAALFGLGQNTIDGGDSIIPSGNYTAETMAYALIPFAAQGIQAGSDAGGAMHPVSILRIEQAGGEVEDPQPAKRKSLIADNLAYLVHNVFSQESGSLSLPDRPSAAKTGIPKGESALWISGYTTELSISMRIGDPQTVSPFVTDGNRLRDTAVILWRSVMEFAHQDRPVSGWEIPKGISQVRICLPSGKLPTAACQETMTDVFLRGNEPYEYDEYYAEVPINRQNRMLATRCTPPEDVVSEVFLNLPAEAADWAAANGIEALPSQYDPIRTMPQNEQIQIEAPGQFQTFSADDSIDIIVRLSLKTLPESMQVSIGAGMYPQEWKEVCSGGQLENGQWLLCTLDPAAFEPGLYALRTAFTLPGRSYQSAETYFQIN